MDQSTATTFFPPARIAVSALFFLNGFMIGSWAPKIPVFAARLGLSEAGLGLMILAFGLGSLVTMPVVGGQIARLGSAAVLRIVAVLLVPALVLLTLAPTVLLAVPAIIFFGAVAGGMDIAMNANAIVVERRMRRAIMSSCHGCWSLGGLIGAGSGGFLIATYGPLGHAFAVAILGALILFAITPSIAGDTAHHETGDRTPIRLPRTLLPYLIGIVALFSMVPEGAVLDWGALYLRKELGAGLALSGLGFGAFSAMMALMRFAGDTVRDRLGAVRTLRICTFLAFGGMMTAGLASNAVIAVLGFAIAGVAHLQHGADRLFRRRQCAGPCTGHCTVGRHFHGLFRHPVGPVGHRLCRRAHDLRGDLHRPAASARGRLRPFRPRPSRRPVDGWYRAVVKDVA